MEKQAWPVTVIRSQRKTISVRVTPAGQVEVRAPAKLPKAQIDDFLNRHRAWIAKHLQQAQANLQNQQGPAAKPYTDAELMALARRTEALLIPRLPQFASRLGVSYGRVTIGYRKSRWGSCSSNGNLSFNCLLALCPDDVVDYVAVHELCHRKEMNHSPKFWALVKSALPDYARRREWLKTQGRAIITRPRG